MKALGHALALAGALFVLARDARAQTATPEHGAVAPSVGPDAVSGVAFGADEVRLDARSQSLDVSGRVRVDQPPFHLTSESLTLKRVPIGVELVGQGRLAFCPCLGTPLAVRFSGATVAPPYDLILKEPVVEVFGVPVAWAPAMWLRSSSRFGLLPPDLAWRGADGLFVGGGVHVPWRPGDATRGVDLRAGGYVEGGVAVQAAVSTASTSTRVGWDHLHGDDGLTLDARGATATTHDGASSDTRWVDSAAWRVAALRGPRAVRAATDVDEAAKPFDRAQGEASWSSSGWTIASRVETVALRGGDLADFGASGPVLAVRRSDALIEQGAYDATFEAGQLAGAGLGAMTFARGESNAALATRWGAIGGSLGAHGLGQVGEDTGRRIAAGAAQVRMKLALPLARGFDSSEPTDPWVHTTEPYVEAAAIATRDADTGVLPGGRGMTAPSGTVWVTAAGWANALGRWGSRSAGEIDATAGAVGTASHALAAVRGRAAASGPWVSLRADVARVGTPADAAGGAFVAQGRLGPRTGLYLGAHVAERDGIDPVVARALVDPTLEPASGFLTTPGWTGGLRLGVPFGSRLTARGGADVDLDARQLVAAVGAVELHDPCNCVVVRASGSERIGRGGVDVWISVDLPVSSP